MLLALEEASEEVTLEVDDELDADEASSASPMGADRARVLRAIRNERDFFIGKQGVGNVQTLAHLPSDRRCKKYYLFFL